MKHIAGKISARINLLPLVAAVAGCCGFFSEPSWGQDITHPPRPLTIATGYPASFYVAATGPGTLTYQWLKDGTNIDGATRTNYNLPSVQFENAGDYSVIANGSGWSRTSVTARLEIVLPYTFSTFAGMPRVSGTNDGLGTAARFYWPHGLAADQSNNIYVAEYGNSIIRRITPGGLVTTVAGNPGSTGTNDGVGSAAMFNKPQGVAVDRAGILYVADTSNEAIRRITPDGTVTTLAGRAGSSGTSDGTGDAARFFGPAAVVVDSATNLYVADTANNAIRCVTCNGTVSTLAGRKAPSSRGYHDGIGTNALFYLPCGMGMDNQGNIYVADQNNHAIRKIAPGAVVSTLAGLGNGLSGYVGSTDGNGDDARFYYPHGGAVDQDGNIYVADMENRTVRRVTPDGRVTTLGGLAGNNGAVDGAGTAARFAGVRGTAVDSYGNLYVADFENQIIRKGVPFAVSTLPQSQGVTNGTPVLLSVSEAQGDNGPFGYQWFCNSSPLPNQTNLTLDLGPVVRTNSGVYSVMVSNAVGNWIVFNATVRALVAPIIQSVQPGSNGVISLFSQDADGGLPYDPSQVQVQWRTNLPSSTDTNWQLLSSGFYFTNGWMVTDDTNDLSQPSRFYRVLER